MTSMQQRKQFNRQPTPAQPHGLKTAASAQMGAGQERRLPVALPSHRPQPALRTAPSMEAAPRFPKPLVAPPVYRPQPKPLALQAKPVNATGAANNQSAAQVRVSAPRRAGNGSYRITAGAGARQVGSVMVHVRGKSVIEVTDLGVDAAHRKQGLGSTLIASALRAGLQRGKTRVVLNSQDNGSGRLTQWYQSMGFARTGASRRGYPQLEASINQVLSKVAQRQIASPLIPRHPGTIQRKPATLVAFTTGKSPIAPPAYRPHPIPKVLQAKKLAATETLSSLKAGNPPNLSLSRTVSYANLRLRPNSNWVIQRMYSAPLSPDSAYWQEDISSEESSGDEWDPAEHAVDPLVADDFSASGLRKGIGFTVAAKAHMKTDTPKKGGKYICHICSQPLKPGQDIDMDHIPAWHDRVKAYFAVDQPQDEDELAAPILTRLYNMRGSVFAHSSCNRGHSGEGNWKQMWSSVKDWYKHGGGPAIDKNKY